MMVLLRSPDGSRNIRDLSNEAIVRLKDELVRLPGIADVTCLGCIDCGARVKLNAEKLAASNLTAGDVVAASSGRTPKRRPRRSASRQSRPARGFRSR